MRERVCIIKNVSIFIFSLTLFLLSITECFADTTAFDMAGRRISLSAPATKIATIGPVPVLNGFAFALGEQAAIVNGLPPSLGGPRWWMQYRAAPGLDQRPVIQSADGLPALETILGLAPQLVLTMDRRTIDTLDKFGLPVVFLAWRQPEDVKAVIRLLGELLGRREAAETYCRYFDETLGKVAAKVDSIPQDQRPRVLYASLARLTQPHLIAEWWIAKAGGRSVTDDGRNVESLTFSIEQLLAWNPEVMILANRDEIAAAYADPRLAELSAVRNHRIFSVPLGTHVWGNRTIEQPLTVLWAAGLFHPDLFQDLPVRREMTDFYARFVGLSLSSDDIERILAGAAK